MCLTNLSENEINTHISNIGERIYCFEIDDGK